MRRERLRRSLALLVVALGVPACLFFVAGLALYRDLTVPYKGYRGEEVFVEVPPGATARRIAQELQEAGVVPSALALRLHLRWSGEGSRLQAGEYRFAGSLSPVEAAGRILRGEVFLHRLTVPEGLDLGETADLMVRSGYWDRRRVEEALADVGLISDLAPGAASLEGYLFPETYAFPRSATAHDLVRSMTDRFRQVFGPELREAAGALGLSVHETVVLASLVEKEVRLAEESGLVASVIHNRLRKGMRLEIDATVIYALRLEGGYKPPLTRRDLECESPYNTYRIAGLPPGPIASPGGQALRAAAGPAETDYLYYVLKPDGGGAHAFSRTYREHSRAVRRLHGSRRSR